MSYALYQHMIREQRSFCHFAASSTLRSIVANLHDPHSDAVAGAKRLAYSDARQPWLYHTARMRFER